MVYLEGRNYRIKTFGSLTKKNIISKGMISKIAGSGLEYKHLCIAYKRGGRDGLLSVLMEMNSQSAVRVTKDKKILNALADYFEMADNQ